MTPNLPRPSITPREASIALAQAEWRSAKVALARFVLALEAAKHDGIGSAELQAADAANPAEAAFNCALPAIVAIAQSDTAALLHGQRGRA